MNRSLIIAISALLTLSHLSGQTIETDENALFGGSGEIVADEAGGESAVSEEELFGGELIAEVDESQEDLSTVLLSSEGVEIGGRFRFDASSNWMYDGVNGPFGAEIEDENLTLDLGALLFLDARPYETFRVFAEADVSFPFSEDGTERSFDDVFHVSELFSDFQFGDSVFFRAGKQTINWGVGFFFSPADLLNITEIDPEDPDAELEGPVSLKIQIPLDVHNVYLYTVFEDAEQLEEVAVAPKMEILFGNTEIGLGAFYRQNNAPAVMTTLTTSLSAVDVFAEGVLSFGSDRTFVVEDDDAVLMFGGFPIPLGVSTETYDDTVFPSITAGIRYNFSDDYALFDVSVAAQYYYNGQGYADPGFLGDNADAVGILLFNDELTVADLSQIGRHYGAVNVTWVKLLDSDFTLGGLWLGNLADGSGIITPSLSWNVIDDLDVSLRSSFYYGDEGDEYTPFGDSASLTLSVNFGGGDF